MQLEGDKWQLPSIILPYEKPEFYTNVMKHMMQSHSGRPAGHSVIDRVMNWQQDKLPLRALLLIVHDD